MTCEFHRRCTLALVPVLFIWTDCFRDSHSELPAANMDTEVPTTSSSPAGGNVLHVGQADSVQSTILRCETHRKDERSFSTARPTRSPATNSLPHSSGYPQTASDTAHDTPARTVCLHNPASQDAGSSRNGQETLLRGLGTESSSEDVAMTMLSPRQNYVFQRLGEDSTVSDADGAPITQSKYAGTTSTQARQEETSHLAQDPPQAVMSPPQCLCNTSRSPSEGLSDVFKEATIASIDRDLFRTAFELGRQDAIAATLTSLRSGGFTQWLEAQIGPRAQVIKRSGSAAPPSLNRTFNDWATGSNLQPKSRRCSCMNEHAAEPGQRYHYSQQSPASRPSYQHRASFNGMDNIQHGHAPSTPGAHHLPGPGMYANTSISARERSLNELIAHLRTPRRDDYRPATSPGLMSHAGSGAPMQSPHHSPDAWTAREALLTLLLER
jgi:hypothetical protein